MAKPQDWASNPQNKPEKWGREIPLEQLVNPVVFHFRPHTFVAVSPENRAAFEKYFEENVGFPPPKMTGVQEGARAAAYPNGGISGSNGGWDDCIP